MSRFITFYRSVRVRLVRLAESLVSRLATPKQAARDHVAAAARHIGALAAPARRAIGAGVARLRALAAPGLAHAARLLVPARARAAALVRPVRMGLGMAAGVAITSIAARLAFDAALEVGLGVAQLAILSILVHAAPGFAPGQAPAALRHGLRVAAAAALLWIGTAGTSMGAAIEPRPAAPDVEPVPASSAMPPIITAHDAAVAPEREVPDSARHADRRTPRRAAGTNGRA